MEDDDADRMKLLLERGQTFSKFTGDKNGSKIYGDIVVISLLTTWSLYYLSRNKNLQNRLKDKEEDVIIFLSEIIRVTGLVPFSARVLKQTINILGHTVEEGTLVINSLSSVWWDSKNFPDPEEVKLERKQNNILDQIHPNVKSSSSIFIVQNIVLQFLKKFKLKLADQDLIVRPKFNFINKPDCDIWLKLQKK